MAAQRIRASSSSIPVLPRCRSEGTLIDLSETVSEASLTQVTVPSPSALRLDSTTSFSAAREVVAIKDYCPSSFTTLKFSKGDRLYVLDSSGGEWWYAHNNTEMGYIPAAYVQPLHYRDSSFSDSGMIDTLGDISEDPAKELDLLGEWPGGLFKPQLKNPTVHSSTNPFLNSTLDQNSNQSSVDLLFFDTPPADFGSIGSVLSPLSPAAFGPSTRRDNPFFRSKRSYSLSELSILQSQSDNPQTSSGFFGALKAPAPEQFQSREDFREAWLTHRKLARSCHDLDSIGQNPGWGQTQPVETNIVCRLDHSGGAVQLPDTNISIFLPEGHVLPGDTQQISLKALLDPSLELNNDRCTTVSPVVEIKLSNMETKSTLTLEMKLSVALKMESRQSTELLCVRSDCKEGPYTPVPQAYMYGDTVQVRLDNLEPCMYVCVVAQSKSLAVDTTVWEQVVKKITLGVYGPKHIHPLFKTVVAIFGHDCAPKTLLVNEVGKQAQAAPTVSLQLWGKHQFVLSKPQDLYVGVYSNMANYKVKPSEAKVVRGFQVKLGKVSRLVFVISSQSEDELSDFTLRIQAKTDNDRILAQFCVQTPTAPPKAGPKSSVQRRFLKKKEVGKIVLSPLAIASKYPVFHDQTINNLKFGKLIKTVIRQNKNQYLLEYKKGDFVMLLSDEKIRLKGQLWTKEWFVGYYRGKVGLVHAKNLLMVGKIKPVHFDGPQLTTSELLEQLLKPAKFLTYIYASVRTVLMENIGDWRSFADALGYKELPLSHFCRTEQDSEPEKVASVLEKLKGDCNNTEGRERKSFQKELLTALLRLDCQGLVLRLLLHLLLLTTAVEVSGRWRELADKLVRALSRQQMDAYEAPHRDRSGQVDREAMWKPAYDFLVTWAGQTGDSPRDVLQELHLGLDRMKSPITRTWRHLTGTLVLVHGLDLLRSQAFRPAQDLSAVRPHEAP